MIIFLRGSLCAKFKNIIVVTCNTASTWRLQSCRSWRLYETLLTRPDNENLFCALAMYIYSLQDRTSPIQSYGPSGSIDWSTAAQPSSSVAQSSHYYSSSLPSHHTSGYSPYSGWDSAPQTAYSPYNVPPSHCEFTLNFCKSARAIGTIFSLQKLSFCQFNITM